MSYSTILNYHSVVEKLSRTADSTDVDSFYRSMQLEMETEEGKRCQLKVYDAGDDGWMISYLNDYEPDFETCWDRARNKLSS